VKGGFGYGRFGSGEFGYYNAVVEWVTPHRWSDGLHSFGVRLYKPSGAASATISRVTIMIASVPDDPPAMRFEGMTGGECRFSVMN
jgi:hypothetical protein